MHEAGHAVIGEVIGFRLAHVEVYPGGVVVAIFPVFYDDEPRRPARESEGRMNQKAVDHRATLIEGLRADRTRFDAVLRWTRTEGRRTSAQRLGSPKPGTKQGTRGKSGVPGGGNLVISCATR